MGSSKKTKDRDREKTREEKKKKKHRSRSRSKEKERHHRHRHKKRSHRKDQQQRSHSPLSDVSDASSDNTAAFASGSVPVAVPPPPRISEPSYTPPSSPPPPPRGHKRGYGEDGDEEQQQQAEFSQPPAKKGREGGMGGGWDENSGPVGGDGGAGASLSVEETNRIRAKLGLKPLQVESSGATGEEEGDDTDLAPGERRMKEDSNEFIHKPATNIREKLQVEKLREKIAAQREKRRLKEKLSSVKTLGDSDSEDDALAWVSKNRKLTKERQEAEKKAKQLEELDAEFGIGELVEQEVAKDQRRAYSRNHLSGLKVQHHHSRFADGNTILTLADADVLGESEDTLVNVNLIDQERAERNIERRRAKPDEPTDYEAPELDESGQLVSGGLLKKYDEELTGPKQASFRLGRRGLAVVEDDTGLSALGAKEQRLAKLKQLHNLSGSATAQLVTEYMTQDEATATFRKVKKKKKKKKMLTADDLQPLEDGEIHHGSRHNRVLPGDRQAAHDPIADGQEVPDRIKSLRELMEEDVEQSGAMEVGEDIADNGAADDDDEGLNDDFELQEALANARKAQLSKMMQPRVQDLKEMLETNEPSTSAGQVSLSDLLPEDTGLVVTLNTTDEFCRTLGDLPTYGLSGNRAEDEQSALQLQQGRTAAPVSTHAGAWEEVGIEDTRVEISEARPAPILDEEPDASKGVASALRLAIKKGYLEKSEIGKKGNAGLQHLRAINYSIDDKAGDDDRRGRGGGDRYCGPLSDFKEKDGYKPKISLEYVDDEGRKLCPKEAFRYLSHKFHGKGSGKNKTEKRMKKWKEELLMKQMSSSDTPLQTLERQIDKQKALGTSYLVLSGSKNQEPAAATETKIRK